MNHEMRKLKRNSHKCGHTSPDSCMCTSYRIYSLVLASNKRLTASFFSLTYPMAPKSRPSSDVSAFREIFRSKKNIAVLTGAGVSAESGIPTFRGAGGFWRKFQAQQLATPEAFSRSPSLVWEFYHYRRELVLTKQPNKAHEAIAKCQKLLQECGKKMTIVTQNIDGFHQAAGAQDVIELHGSLFKTRCTKCHNVEVNRESPICEALLGKGQPDADADTSDISVTALPHCVKSSCGGLLRPHVVWFGEGLDPNILSAAERTFEECDLCLVIGTSSVVYPAAMFAPMVADRGVPVAEFNIETTPSTNVFQYHFEGPSATTVPEALGIQ